MMNKQIVGTLLGVGSIISSLYLWAAVKWPFIPGLNFYAFLLLCATSAALALAGGWATLS
jgi:hypothetical protein